MDAVLPCVVLRSKPFLLGDELTAADCSAFGLLDTLLHSPARRRQEFRPERLVRVRFPSLVAYAQRIRKQVYGLDSPLPAAAQAHTDAAA